MRLSLSNYRILIVSLFVITSFVSVTAAGQERAVWETGKDIQSGRNGSMAGTVDSVDTMRLIVTLRPDSDSLSRVKITTDAATTRYVGFGSGTNSDIVRGERGFKKVNKGDRLQIHGVGSTAGAMAASEIRLLGRPLTDTQSDAPTTRTNTRTPLRADQIEGTVRSINATENRFVVESSDRKFHTIRGTADTPVTFKGSSYRIRNLEVGDLVRIDTERRTLDDVRPRAIEVIRSVSDSNTGPGERTIGALAGRVASINAREETFMLEPVSGRDVRVDVSEAENETGRAYRITEVRVGDYVEVSGRYDTAGLLRADTVRRRTREEVYDRRDDDDDNDDEDDDERIFDRDDDDDDDDEDKFANVVVSGRIVDSLSSSDFLTIRDEANKRDIEILVDDELIARTRTGGYVLASQLRIGESVTIRAFRHNRGTYIAQTIRVR